MIKRALLSLCFVLTTALSWAADGVQIADISFVGNQRVKEQTILNAISLKAGQVVTTADIDEAIQDLYRMGRFSDIAAAILDVSGAKILEFSLIERPLIRNIRFEGNDELTSERLRGVITVKVPDIYDPFELEKSIHMIKAEYVKDGYYAAEITADGHVVEGNEALVTFRIKEGEIVRIKEIRFDGNTVFDEDELKDFMDTQEKWFLTWLTGRGNYDEMLLDQDLERISDAYFNEGYVRVKVRKPVISLVDDRSNMLILIHVDEGDQFSIKSIDAVGELLWPEKKGEMLNLVPLRPGDVFSRAKLRKGVESMTDLYADQGYAYVNVAPLTRVNDTDKNIELTLDIEKGPRVSIERINISGNTKTRDKVIRREMKLAEGELYNATALKRSRARINNLGFFETVDITTSPGTDEQNIDVDVNVKERSTGTFSIGVGYSTADGVVGQGSITQENFLGRGWKLNLAASLGSESATYQLGLTDPYFMDTLWTVGGEVYRTEREWTDFSRRSSGGAIKVGHPIGEYSRILFVYRFEQKDIYDVDPLASLTIREEEGSSTTSSITTSFSMNTTDNRLDPSTGGAFDASWEFAGLGGTEKFSKYLVDYRHFWPWRWGTVFSAHGQAGYVHAFGGEEVPLDERFYLGGINSLRGFDNREVGPRDPLTGDYTGGDKQTFFNFEYIFPIFKDLGVKGVTFFDVGNSWGEDEDFFEDWRYSTGAGIRWMSPMGPLRLEYGYNLDPDDDESRSKFEFMVGRFF